MPEVCPERFELLKDPIRPLRVLCVAGVPNDTVLIYADAAPGTFPGHPGWVPLERRAVKIVP